MALTHACDESANGTRYEAHACRQSLNVQHFGIVENASDHDVLRCQRVGKAEREIRTSMPVQIRTLAMYTVHTCRACEPVTMRDGTRGALPFRFALFCSNTKATNSITLPASKAGTTADEPRDILLDRHSQLSHPYVVPMLRPRARDSWALVMRPAPIQSTRVSVG